MITREEAAACTHPDMKTYVENGRDVTGGFL